MNSIEQAQHLASTYGFRVFPCIPNGKLPAIKDFPNVATNDPEKIAVLFQDKETYNIGIAMGDGFVAVDVDVKSGKNGEETILKLELEGREFPPTLEQKTPTGGRHLIYRCREDLRQGVSVFGSGLDLRSKGGFIVGAGSSIGGQPYTLSDHSIGECPDWIIESRRILPGNESQLPAKQENPGRVDRIWAVSRAVQYLIQEAPIAVAGQGGDHTTFTVAAKLRDFGVDERGAMILMSEHYNPRCEPPWSMEDLALKVSNAFNYAQNVPASLNPSAQFDVINQASPEDEIVERFNKRFAFVAQGGRHHIAEFEPNGKISRHNEDTFHRVVASDFVIWDNKRVQCSKIWMLSKNRRSYKGYCFRPGLEAYPGTYNLWSSFDVEPYKSKEESTPSDKRAIEMWLSHARDTICAGVEAHFQWVVGFFAHLIQRPWEKPLVALVLQGGKGTGKSSFVQTIGKLMPDNFVSTSNRRYLSGNFNSHLEANLLYVLEEVFWAGDKQMEGILKDLVTGDKHVIERKGYEPYSADNLSRVVIIGNEDWVVPASADERRFAVFDLGARSENRNAFFQEMRERMESGGNRLLLRYLLDFDLSYVDINTAPETKPLFDQKKESMKPVEQFIYQVLLEERIPGSDMRLNGTEINISKRELRFALKTYMQEHGMKSWVPSERSFGKTMKKLIPSASSKQIMVEGEREYFYFLPPLEEARAQFKKSMGMPEEDWSGN